MTNSAFQQADVFNFEPKTRLQKSMNQSTTSSEDLESNKQFASGSEFSLNMEFSEDESPNNIEEVKHGSL